MSGRSEPPGCPPEVLAAIPWYPDDLERHEREAVESHASECLDCRRELEARIADPGMDADWPRPDPNEMLTRVLARIELGEAEDLREWARAPRRTRAVRWLRESELRVPGFARPVSLSRGLGVAASFGAAMAAAALFFGAGPDGSERSAEPEAPTVAYEGAPRIDVVFRGDLTEAEMRSTLDGIGGEIVAGPSTRGRYQIALPLDTSPGAVCDTLVDHGVAVYAEPVLD